jgi:biopolymer transport protein ExbD
VPLKTTIDELPSLNLTPMVDVIFNLLIFFMLATRFADMEERGIELRVPEVGGGAALSQPAGELTILIRQDGSIVLDGKTLGLAELTEALAAARRMNSAVGVVLRADGDGRFEQVAKALAACRAAGVDDLEIAVRRPSSDGTRKRR